MSIAILGTSLCTSVSRHNSHMQTETASYHMSLYRYIQIQQLRGKLEREEYVFNSFKLITRSTQYKINVALVLQTMNFTICMYTVSISTKHLVEYMQTNRQHCGQMSQNIENYKKEIQLVRLKLVSHQTIHQDKKKSVHIYRPKNRPILPPILLYSFFGENR